MNEDDEDALESPVCRDFAHDQLDTLCASWAPNLFQGKLFLSQADLRQWLQLGGHGRMTTRSPR